MNKFPSLLLLILLSACTKTVVDVPPQEDTYPIVFDEIETRTLTTDMTFMDFRVWGETAPGAADVFDGVTVTRISQDGAGWTYDDPRYWVVNQVYDFYAVSPASVVMSYASDDYGFDYTMPDNIAPDLATDAGHVDIVTAHEKRQTGEISQEPPTVNLTFGHTLAKINIKISKAVLNNSHTMRVKNVYLWGMKTSGTYRFASGWTCSEAVGAASLTDIDMELPDNAVPVTIGGILAVPQTLSADQVYLLVEYTYSHGSNASSKILSTALPTAAVSEWTSGTEVTYSAVLAVEQDIRIDTPEVEPWGTEQVGGTIIIR